MDDTTSLVGILLTAIFVGLKLAGWVTWSWLFVFAPIWVPGVLALGLEASIAAVVGVGLYLLISGGHLADLGIHDMNDIFSAVPGADELGPMWAALKEKAAEFF